MTAAGLTPPPGFDHSGPGWPRRVVQTRRALVILVAGVALSGCGRTVEEQAAVRAQEACIAALEPVARDQRPSAGALQSAARSAGEAARVDERWASLRRRVDEFRTAVGKGNGGESLHSLMAECERVNRIVKEERDDV